MLTRTQPVLRFNGDFLDSIKYPTPSSLAITTKHRSKRNVLNGTGTSISCHDGNWYVPDQRHAVIDAAGSGRLWSI
jgi:hypothetical protein